MTSLTVPRRGASDHVPAWSLAVTSIVTVQLGAALSVKVFGEVAPGGAAWLRLVAGGVIFLLLVRPDPRAYTLRELRVPALLGVITAVMTVSFLFSISRIPLGTAVSIEFLGPLAVGVLRSPSTRALTWPFMAFAGVLALTHPWTGTVDLVGVAFALAAATGWAFYILLTQHVGDRFAGLEGLAISIPVAAVAASVVGIPQVSGHLTASLALQSVGLAVLFPVIPFSLELLALRRLTTAAFGTLMAFEPAFGTLWGVLLLSQVPNALQVAGVALVVGAGIGAERNGHRDRSPTTFESPGTA
jgi:inner membrane transporter RhtA